jgi:hypothetical protein
MESTLAGWHSTLFSLTRAAAVYCGIMKPELMPVSFISSLGSRHGPPATGRCGARKCCRSRPGQWRRSPALKASGWPWKLPPEMMSPSSKTSGLSVTEFSSHLDDSYTVIERVATGAVHLRNAAQAIGILHLAAVAMRLEDFAQPSSLRICAATLIWPGCGRDRMDAWIEWPGRALQGFQAHGAEDVGGIEQVHAHGAE